MPYSGSCSSSRLSARLTAPAPFKYVSTKRRVREDRRFVSGQATFVSDVTPPGTLHAAVLTSPYACARIASIDAADAWRCRAYTW